MASRQGFGELKTEQLGGHSQEQQRHRQAPIDDDDDRLGALANDALDVLTDGQAVRDSNAKYTD